jgi:hypothetical protein
MSRVFWSFVAASVSIVAGAAIFGDERQLGAAVAIAVVTGAVGYGLSPLLRMAKNRLAASIVVACGALAIGCALLPVLEGLALTDPLVRGELRAPGDVLVLPSGVASDPLRRVLVHVPPPKEPARIHVELQGGETTLRAELDSSLTTVRLGRRGHGQRLVQNDSQFIDVVLPSGVSSLALKSVSGLPSGAVTVEVFREWVPDWSVFVLSVALILGLAAVSALSGVGGSPAGGIACASIFGLIAHRTVTPEHALRPELGALFVALVIGAFGGAMLTLLIERYASSRMAAPAAARS